MNHFPVTWGRRFFDGPAPRWLYSCHDTFFKGLGRYEFIPTQTVGSHINELVDEVWWHQSGMCYAILVPPGGKLVVDLEHPNLGWLTHTIVGKWGTPEVGMLQNKLKFNGAPATCTNPTDKAKMVYLVVSDPTGISYRNPYRLTFHTSWKPADVQGMEVPAASGIWKQSWSLDMAF